MPPLIADQPIFANILLGSEDVLVLAVILVLFLSKRIPDIARGLGEGISRFKDASDQAAHEAGKSLGGIFGRPAAEALTPDNQTAELYDPAVFQEKRRADRRTKLLRRWLRFCRWRWSLLVRRVKSKR